jgi:hypothetical protein
VTELARFVGQWTTSGQHEPDRSRQEYEASQAVIAQRIQILIVRPLRLIHEALRPVRLEAHVVATGAAAEHRAFRDDFRRRAPEDWPAQLTRIARQSIEAFADVGCRTVEQRACHDDRSGGFTYQPRNRNPGFARTAAGIYSLQVCGQYDDPRVERGAQYLIKNRTDRQWFTYGNFYAAPAMYMIGGETWERWYNQLKTQLLAEGAYRTQGDLIYWEPRWDSNARVGSIYSTAVYTMILAMPYHYIPLYQR